MFSLLALGSAVAGEWTPGTLFWEAEAVSSREGLGAFFPGIACNMLGTEAGKKNTIPSLLLLGRENQEGATQERQANICID